jgi:purine nucleoside permease
VNVLRAVPCAVLLAALWPAFAPAAAAGGAEHPGVLLVATFPAEAQRWVARDRLTRRIPIDGLAAPLACDESGAECLIVSGTGKVNATASLLVAGTSPVLDLRGAYIVLAGIAGTSPDVASIGSVAVAGWIVDGDLTYEIDPREPLTHERFARSPLDWRAGTEVFRLDRTLRAWALARARSATLLDSPRVRRFRARFAATPAGGRAPAVDACDVLGDDTYWQGAIMSAYAASRVTQLTGGRGTYCMSSMEDTGVAAAVQRLAAIGRADAARLVVLRGLRPPVCRSVTAGILARVRRFGRSGVGARQPLRRGRTDRQGAPSARRRRAMTRIACTMRSGRRTCAAFGARAGLRIASL